MKSPKKDTLVTALLNDVINICKFDLFWMYIDIQEDNVLDLDFEICSKGI